MGSDPRPGDLTAHAAARWRQRFGRRPDADRLLAGLQRRVRDWVTADILTLDGENIIHDPCLHHGRKVRLAVRVDDTVVLCVVGLPRRVIVTILPRTHGLNHARRQAIAKAFDGRGASLDANAAPDLALSRPSAAVSTGPCLLVHLATGDPLRVSLPPHLPALDHAADRRYAHLCDGQLCGQPVALCAVRLPDGLAVVVRLGGRTVALADPALLDHLPQRLPHAWRHLPRSRRTTA